MSSTRLSGGGHAGHANGAGADMAHLGDLIPAVRVFLRDYAANDSDNARLTEAWQTLYMACNALFHRCGDAAGLDADEREDCVQDCWLAVVRALRSPDRLPATDGFVGWLWHLARNKATDIRRRGAARARVFARYASTHWSPPDAPEPSARMELAEKTMRIQVALERLRATCGEVNHAIIIMRYVDAKDNASIGTQLGLTSAQVRRRSVRARDKLRVFLRRMAHEDQHISLHCGESPSTKGKDFEENCENLENSRRARAARATC